MFDAWEGEPDAPSGRSPAPGDMSGTAAEPAAAGLDPRWSTDDDAVVATLRDVPGGPELARLLPTLLDHLRTSAPADGGACDLDPDAEALAAAPIQVVVELAAAYRRVESWAVSRAAAVAAELARRPEMNPLDRASVPTAARTASALRAPAMAGTELALRLGMSRTSARRLVAVGTALDGALGATCDALAAGAIDWPKACALAESLAGVPWQVAHAVEDRVLPRAPERTPGELRRDIAAALLQVDPEDAHLRHRRARATRRVEHARPLPDGMALIRAVLPADAAVRLDITLQAAATHAKATGDGRTVDQLRADALDSLATAAWHAGVIAPELPASTAHRNPDVAGVASPSGSESAGSRPSLGPWAPDRAPTALRLSHTHRGAQIHVTVDLATLLGLRDNPAELRGYGPVPAEVARILASDATWRRLITDPMSGMVLDVGTTRYRPPANLDELIRLRHPRCVSPGCAVPAHRCDTDHITPWAPGCGGTGSAGASGAATPGGRGGRTSAENLAPLCRGDHLLKTHAGFRLSQPRPGRFELTTPAGHTYLTSGAEGPDPPF